MVEQRTMFFAAEMPVEYENSPLELTLRIRLNRTPRTRCSVCGKRRICYNLSLGTVYQSSKLCAEHAGVR